jgi:hypothetical protein
MKTLRNIIYAALVACAFVSALSPLHALSPPPDGGYPGGNTAEGQNALFSLTSGGYNTAVGFLSLTANTTNSFNTALGAGTLLSNAADYNTAIGAGALLSNDIGNNNTAAGAFALFSNNTGTANTATGQTALFSNTTGFGNTAIGVEALKNNTTTNFNTAIGLDALLLNADGHDNTAVGVVALALNTSGNLNTAVGDTAGSSLTTGSFNICIGASVTGVAGESNTIRIGDNLPETPGASACYIGGIAGQTVDPSGAGTVYIDNAGKLGVFLSSQRFKRDVRPMENASEAILSLKPVTFHYKNDGKNTPCFGLVAEQVAEVNPDLVVRNQNGELLTVRYEAVNAMLLNEFLKEYKRVEAQESKIEKQEATIAQLKNVIETIVVHFKEQDSEIQKVRDQMQMSRSDAQLAITNQ